VVVAVGAGASDGAGGLGGAALALAGPGIVIDVSGTIGPATIAPSLGSAVHIVCGASQIGHGPGSRFHLIGVSSARVIKWNMHTNKPATLAAFFSLLVGLCPLREHRDPAWNPDAPHSELPEPVAPLGGFSVSVTSMTTTTSGYPGFIVRTK
jgi:hypothetical protein